MIINGRQLGPSHPVYFVAEISGNHNGSFERAIKLIDAAKDAGADAVKLQTYTADTLTIDFDGPGFVLDDGLWAGRKLYDLYRETHTPWDWQPKLFQHAKDIGITCFSSVFDRTSVDFLEKLGCPAYKIASFEITDIPLIGYASATRKPIIISTGAGTLTEIATAAGVVENHGTDVALLHCVSEYPATDPKLFMLGKLRQFADVIGFSDHTKGTFWAKESLHYGACIIEKHLTLSPLDEGPDAEFSLDAERFKEMVDATRPKLSNLRRSLYVVEDVRKGEKFTINNVRSIRPGFGLPPVEIRSVLNRVAAIDLKRGTPLARSHLA